MSGPREPKIVQIRADFPVPVEISRVAAVFLHEALGAICADYEASHPDRVMWVFGQGALGLMHWGMVDEDHPMRWDDSVEHFEIAEREGYPKELEQRAKVRQLETKGRLIDAAPALLWFARQIFNGLETGAFKIETDQDETLEAVLRKGKVAIARATGV